MLIQLLKITTAAILLDAAQKVLDFVNKALGRVEGKLDALKRRMSIRITAKRRKLDYYEATEHKVYVRLPLCARTRGKLG